MGFIDEVNQNGAAHLVTDRNIRDLAIKNMWKGFLLFEKKTGLRIRWCEKVAAIEEVCKDMREPIGRKAIEKIVNGLRIDHEVERCENIDDSDSE